MRDAKKAKLHDSSIAARKQNYLKNILDTKDGEKSRRCFCVVTCLTRLSFTGDDKPMQKEHRIGNRDWKRETKIPETRDMSKVQTTRTVRPLIAVAYTEEDLFLLLPSVMPKIRSDKTLVLLQRAGV